MQPPGSVAATPRPMSLLRQGTYSIVARDARSGELGVAVQSHWFSVGSIVAWAKAGVGAVATQANAEISYGPRLLELIEAGQPVSAALSALLDGDASAASRQVAAVDAVGAVATHTGDDCIEFAGHVTADGVSCQANIMASRYVWGSMLDAFQTAPGSLSERLLFALEAAEGAGGDARGRQSAAILVVPAAGEPWDTVVSLRVEDHPEPVTELARLLAVHDAYTLAARADALVAEGRHDEAAELYEQASARAPGNHELLFWAGLGAAQGGDLETGAARVRAAIELHGEWRGLLERLPSTVAPSAAPVLERLSSGSV
jgi:uncharacterized Ntn-hydrolase superfamily protein